MLEGMTRRAALAMTAALVLAADPAPSAKGAMTKIVLAGPALARPIEIVDPAVVNQFQVWAGPGTESGGVAGQTGFIIDWKTGAFANRPRGLLRYEVTFYPTLERLTPDRRIETLPPRIVYVVPYERAPASGRGYVYLPSS